MIELLQRDEAALERILSGLDHLEADTADRADTDLDLRDIRAGSAMSAERTQAIRAAAATRSDDAAARARRVLRELSRRGARVNFAAVAAGAGVSRQFLYTDPELRQEIEATA